MLLCFVFLAVCVVCVYRFQFREILLVVGIVSMNNQSLSVTEGILDVCMYVVFLICTRAQVKCQFFLESFHFHLGNDVDFWRVFFNIMYISSLRHKQY